MHIDEPGIAPKQSHIISREGTSASLRALKRFGMRMICLTIVTIIGVAVLSNTAITPVMAASTAPSKPGSINGAAGNRQVTLSWGAATNATGYLIEQTDLVTRQVRHLPAVMTRTTVGSLATGRWYRFRIIPFSGIIQGIPSDPIEIRTSGFPNSYDHYYVLGDSYSSGEGAPPYSDVQGCYRSTHGYANQLGFGALSPVMIACSGAQTEDIDRVVQYLGLPGTQLQQLQRSPQGNSLVTLTIGGNDVGFAKEMENCVFGLSTCTSRQAAISKTIAALEPRLVQVYREIRKAAPGADILVLGYPLLVAAADRASCHSSVLKTGLSQSEMTMIRQLVGQFNRVIAQAAAQAGVVSVTNQIEQAFAGHEVCTKDQKNEWMNELAGHMGMTHGAFHPNIPGYQADAHAVNTGRTNLYLHGMVRRG